MMDAAERTLLRDAVRDAFVGAGAAAGERAALDPVLAELGWLEMLRTEPLDSIEIVFRSLGAINGGASALDDVVVSALGIEPRADLGVVLPPFATSDPPGSVEGPRMSVAGLATARAAAATEMVVIARSDDAMCRTVVPTAQLELTPVHGVDPDAGFHLVRATLDGVATEPLEGAAWDAAEAAGRRAVAAELAGASRAMLELARTHAIDRVQFDRPIAKFQAVRHRLADALVAVEALDAALTAAREVPSWMTAALAKAVAGRTARTVAAHCQQVLAGVGFTTDHSFHRYLKRSIALEGIFGTADELATELGRELLATRKVPTLIEL